MLFLFKREKWLCEAVARVWVGFYPWPWKPFSHCPIQESECGGGRGWVCQQRGKASAGKGRTLFQDILLRNCSGIAFSTCKVPPRQHLLGACNPSEAG